MAFGISLSPMMMMGGSLDADAVTLFAAMSSQPDGTRKALINSMIISLKDAGFWTRFDLLQVYAAHNSQAARLNWVNPSTFTASAVNSPTFTADRGYTGNGTTSYVNTNWNTSGGANFTTNTGSIATFVQSGSGIVASVEAGSTDTSVAARITASGALSARMSTSTPVNSSVVTATGVGFTAATRLSSSNIRFFKDGAQVGADVASASVGLTTDNVYACGRNNGGVLAAPSTRTIGLVMTGDALTDSEHATLNSIVSTYMTGVGAL